jgi:hypothetical protein
VSVVLAAGLIVVEIALGRTGESIANLSGFAERMMAYHLWIGCGEAILTVGVLWAVGVRVPSDASGRPRRRALAAVTVALLAALAMIPLASELPDGYESAAQRSQMDWLLAE